jgi:hypothetical protein
MIMINLAFDLDDTLIDTGASILRVLSKYDLPIYDRREPYDSLRQLVGQSVITSDDKVLLLNKAMDNAQPIKPIVCLLKRVLYDHGNAYIVSSRSHMNTIETLNILGRILTPDELFRIHLKWCVPKSMDLSDIAAAKLDVLRSMVGVTHFLDDLMFNIKLILDMVPDLTPIILHQPWVEDRRYLPELMDHPRLQHMLL